jgi:hypothetical protein
VSEREEAVERHVRELVRLTLEAGNAAEPLPENEVAALGKMIALERESLIHATSELLFEDQPDAAGRPGIAEFDAGFRYGMAFARALDEAKLVAQRERRGRGRLLTLTPKPRP